MAELERLKRIVSWWWQGTGELPGFSDNVYTEEYVAMLLRGVARHITPPWRLDLFVDEACWKRFDRFDLRLPTDLKLIRFRNWGVGGWSHMCECFHPDYWPQPGDRVLAIGLDSIITGSLDWLFEWNEAPCGFIRDPLVPETISNAVMTFDRQGAVRLWDAFLNAREKKFEGMKIFDLPSEMMMMRKLWEKERWPLLEEEPRRLLSYKVDREKFAPEASVVYFHGNPKPHALEKDDPIYRFWGSGNLSDSTYSWTNAINRDVSNS